MKSAYTPLRATRPPSRGEVTAHLGATSTVNRSQPTHVAGEDPAKRAFLLAAQGARRQRHGDIDDGAARWPRQ